MNAVASAPDASPLLSFHPMSKLNFTRLLAGTVYAIAVIAVKAMSAVIIPAKMGLLNMLPSLFRLFYF